MTDNYTEHQKNKTKRNKTNSKFTSLEWHSIKSTASKLIIMYLKFGNG